jgi:hypothetical protein
MSERSELSEALAEKRKGKLLARWEWSVTERVGAKLSGLLIKMGFPQSGREGRQKDVVWEAKRVGEMGV